MSNAAVVWALLAALSFCVAGTTCAETVPRTYLSLAKHPTARCMDGSPGAYYWAKASDPAASSKWVIELEGGGECTTQKSCKSREGTNLWSSRYDPATESGLANFASDDQRNPLSSWNRVHVPYCSQDLWTGQRTTNASDTYGYYFSGHLILSAVVDELIEQGMGSASHIVLTGESAGGIGVSPNVDWLAGRVPSATVIGAPIAGFYYYADPYTGPGHTQSGLADFREAAWPQHYQLWGSYVDTDCAASLKATPWACVLANNSWPYVSSKMFFTQSMTDKVVLEAHDWVPGPPSSWTAPVTNYVKEWSMNMTKGLGALISARNNDVGVFAAECFIHTGFTPTQPQVDNLTYYGAFASWMGGKTEHVLDSCGILCNPTCPSQ